MVKVYLSGPITGHTSGSIQSWRSKISELFGDDVIVLDPASQPYNSKLSYKSRESASEALSRERHGKLVLERNKHLLRSSDIVLANFLGAKTASIGSVGELFWAEAFQKPVVIVREVSGNVHDHAMINALATVICPTLEEGCKHVEAILGTTARTAATV